MSNCGTWNWQPVCLPLIYDLQFTIHNLIFLFTEIIYIYIYIYIWMNVPLKHPLTTLLPAYNSHWQFTMYNSKFQRKCLSVCQTVASWTWQLVCLPIMRGGRFSQWRFTEFPFALLNLGPNWLYLYLCFSFHSRAFFIVHWQSCLHLYILLCFSSDWFANWKFTKNQFSFVNPEPSRLYLYMCLSNEYF